MASRACSVSVPEAKAAAILILGFGLGLGVLVAAVGSGCAPVAATGCDGTQSCAKDTRCVEHEDGTAACEPVCPSSASCGDDAPICDDGMSVCRDCFPGEDAACQKRSAATPRCVVGRCVECALPGPDSAASAESSDCATLAARSPEAAPAPICDRAQNRCRPCQRHGECASGVCAKDGAAEQLGVRKGSCVPASQVLVVDQTACSQAGPVFCTPKQAFERIDSKRRYVVLRKSAFPADFTDLHIGNLPNHENLPIYLIGPAADGTPLAGAALPPVTLGESAAQDTLTVEKSRVVVEGLYFHGGKAALTCRGQAAQLRLVRSVVAGNDTAIVATGGCELTVDQSWIGRGPESSPFHGASGNARGIDVTASDFHIVNSVLCDNGDYRQDGFGGVRVRSLSSGRVRSTLVNSTLYQQSGLIKTGKYYTSLLCEAPVGDRIVVVNTLLFTDQALLASPEEHFIDPTCGPSLYRIASNDPLLSANQSVVLPMPLGSKPELFKDAPGRDLRLTTHEDARAVATGGALSIDVGGEKIVAPTVDLYGRPRGVSGETVAIGALEPAP